MDETVAGLIRLLILLGSRVENQRCRIISAVDFGD